MCVCVLELRVCSAHVRGWVCPIPLKDAAVHSANVSNCCRNIGWAQELLFTRLFGKVEVSGVFAGVCVTNMGGRLLPVDVFTAKR